MSLPISVPAADSPPIPSGGTILVADDTPENVRLLHTFLSREGYTVITAQDGEEAVRQCRGALPDVIIMDVAMPRLNGLEATRAIRQLYPDTWIPIIFLSAHASEASQAQGLDAGGDDYLVKPVNLAILHEKIKAMRRIAASQARVARYAARLEAAIDAEQADQEFAKHLMQRMLRTQLGVADGVRQWIAPAEHFSGDAILTARGPGGELYIMLADAAGHGLAAAISVLPMIETFYRLAEKGFSVSSIVRELNKKIRQLMPRERFIATTVLTMNCTERSLQIWNGGLPDVCFINDAGQIIRSWTSTHPPLGTETDDALRPQPEVFAWNGTGQLLLYTDGLEEATDASGAPFGIARIRQMVGAHPPAERFDSLVGAVRAHVGAGTAHDDISLITVDCPATTAASVPLHAGDNDTSGRHDADSSWRFSLRLEAAQLRRLDIVPLLIGWLDQLQLAEQHRGTAFMVLAELLNNALDHGLLHLDSRLKQEPDGFERYLILRAERLASLLSGSIELSVEYLILDNAPNLKITIHDSGEGFAHEELISQLDSGNTSPCGRGIPLVRAIAGDLSFKGNGNEATVLLRLPPLPAT